MGADALAPPVDRLWALVRTCEKRIAALASRPLWLDVATVVCQHFPVVLYVAWLRQLLIAVCMQQLVQHAERDTKQMQASTSLRPRYPVSDTTLHQLRASFAYALGRAKALPITSRLPNLSHLLLEAPPGARAAQEQLVLGLAAEFGMRVVVLDRQRSHVSRWLRRQFGDEASGGQRLPSTLLSSLVALVAPAALDALLTEAAFGIAAHEHQPTVLVVQDAHALAREREARAHLERELSQLSARRLPVVVIGLATSQPATHPPRVVGVLARGAERSRSEDALTDLLAAADPRGSGSPTGASECAEDAEPEPHPDAHAAAHAGADGASTPDEGEPAPPRAHALSAGGVRGFAAVVPLEPPAGVRRASWLAQMRHDERALCADAERKALGRVCAQHGLPVDLSELERQLGAADGAGAAIRSEEEMCHVLAWAVGDYLLAQHAHGGPADAPSAEVPRACSAPAADRAPDAGRTTATTRARRSSEDGGDDAGGADAGGALAGPCSPRGSSDDGAVDAECLALACARRPAGPPPEPTAAPPLVLAHTHLQAGARDAAACSRRRERAPRLVEVSDRFEESLLASVVPPGEVGVGWADIATLDEAKQTLREVVTLPLLRPELFSRGNLTTPTKGVLLFGPPGTGKTMLAKAVASEAHASFLQLTLSTIMSKWLGESNKYVRAVFTLCAKLAPAVLFIDEVDSMLHARGNSDEQPAVRELKNEFMLHWDGLRTREWEQVVVLAATNRPFDLDDAILRRLPRRILVPLPERRARLQILSLLLHDEDLDASVSLEQLAARAEGYSGSDLKALCVRAAHQPIRDLLSDERAAGGAAAADLQAAPAAAARAAEQPAAVAAAPAAEADAAVRSPAPPTARASPALRPIRMSDFFRDGVVGQELVIAPSLSRQSAAVEELYRWNEQFGEAARSQHTKQLSYYT